MPFRSFLVDGSPKPGVESVKKHLKIYQLADAANPPEMKFANASGVPANFVAPGDYSFLSLLNQAIQEAPAEGSDPTTLGLFASIGIVHAIDGAECSEIAPGLFLSRSAQVLPMLFSRAPGPGLVPGRLVFGYSGWGAGQLEREMEEGAWLALPYDEELAFSARVDDLWRRCFERLGLNPALLTSSGSGRKH